MSDFLTLRENRYASAKNIKPMKITGNTTLNSDCVISKCTSPIDFNIKPIMLFFKNPVITTPTTPPINAVNKNRSAN